MVQGFDTVLDRPVWSALNGPQAALAQGGSTAMRIDPGYGPFAAAAPGHERELAALLRDVDDEIWLVEDGAVMPPPGTAVRKTARLAQMLATADCGPPDRGPPTMALPVSRWVRPMCPQWPSWPWPRAPAHGDRRPGGMDRFTGFVAMAA